MFGDEDYDSGFDLFGDDPSYAAATTTTAPLTITAVPTTMKAPESSIEPVDDSIGTIENEEATLSTLSSLYNRYAHLFIMIDQ